MTKTRSESPEPKCSSLLIREPKTHANWWTCVPVIPADRKDPRYRVLRRLWADHTMNCIRCIDGAWQLVSNRGFYVHDREDHLTPALFEIFAAFPDTRWVGPLLDLWNVPHGEVTGVNWSYGWEQRRATGKGHDTTDIVLCWEDSEGQGVLVIEAKRPGGHLSKKDKEGGIRYLGMPSLRPFVRKAVVFLVADQDVSKMRNALPPQAPIATWQAMGMLQTRLFSLFEAESAVAKCAASYTARHYTDLGVGFETATEGMDEFGATGTSYESIKSLDLPDGLRRFLIGSQVCFQARSGFLPEPPFDWIDEEPAFVDIASLRQPTSDREHPLWRLRTS